MTKIVVIVIVAMMLIAGVALAAATYVDANWTPDPLPSRDATLTP